jgi:hypothetical protein
MKTRKPMSQAAKVYAQMMQNQNFGKEPTVAQKIINTSRKFGLNGIQNQQGSAVNIYDTINIVTSANPQTLNFFRNTSPKSKTFSNWQTGQLQAGETLGVEYIYLSLLSLSNPDLGLNTAAILDSEMIGEKAYSKTIAYAQSELKIANVTTWKEYQLIEALPQFNPDTQGIAAYLGDPTVPGNVQTIVGRSAVKAPTVPVIPPNQGIEFIITIPPITIPSGNWALMVTLGRQGSIYSAKNAL